MHYIFLSLLFFLGCKSEIPVDDISTRQQGEIKGKNLISVHEAAIFLNDTLSDTQYIAIHISKSEDYLKEHIVGAFNFWRPDYGSESDELFGSMRASRTKIENLLRQIGFNKNSKLILYDGKANVDVMRFVWVLETYGFEDYYIINGGLKSWKMANLETTTRPTNQPVSSKYNLPYFVDTTIVASAMDVLHAIEDTNTILIDTREDYEFLGQPFVANNSVFKFKKDAFINGAIPTAIHINWSQFANLNGDHKIKSYEDLIYDLDAAGVGPEKNIIVYCHSGSRSSYSYYILKEVLNYKNVKNYDGSWIEWSYQFSLDSLWPIMQLTSDKDVDSIYNHLINNNNFTGNE